MNKETEKILKKYDNMRYFVEEIVCYAQIIKIVQENASDYDCSCLVPLVNILRHKTVCMLDKYESIGAELLKLKYGFNM